MMHKIFNFKTIKKAFVVSFSRVFILYLLFALVHGLFVDAYKMKFKTLHHMRPNSFDVISKYSSAPKVVPRKKVLEYLNYFKKIEKYTNMDTESFVMIGFCYHLLNNNKMAEKYFQKSLKLNLSNFWARYNLGALCFQRKDYQKAAESLEKAITITMKKNIDYLSTSRLYYMFETDPNQFIFLIKNGLKEGYRDSFKMLVFSYQKLEDYKAMRKLAISAIAFGVGDQDLFYYLAGLASFHMKEYKSAVGLFAKTLETNPRHAMAYYYSSLCFSRLKNYELANNFLNKATYLKQSKQDTSSYSEFVGLRVF